ATKASSSIRARSARPTCSASVPLAGSSKRTCAACSPPLPKRLLRWACEWTPEPAAAKAIFMSAPGTTPFTVNGRTYRTPAQPVAGTCLDGSADEYFDAALTRGRMPNLQRMAVEGYRGLARGAMPSFTNVNNSSLVTGVSPAVHGIGGNFFYDAATGQEVI